MASFFHIILLARRQHKETKWRCCRWLSWIQGTYRTFQVGFQDFTGPLVVFSMTLQDLVRHVEVLVFFNSVNATFTAHCYRTLNKLLCHFASNVCVVNTNANVLQITGCDQNSSLSSIDSEKSSKNLSHQLFAFPRLNKIFRAWKMWLLSFRTFQDFSVSERTRNPVD